ncbi:MAG: metalloprotease TldD [Alphaproteobacteria bacterium]
MEANSIIEDLIFSQNNIEQNKVINIVTEALNDLEDGELFLEYSQNEAFTLDDGRLKTASYNINSGFGLRGIIEDVFSYAHSSNINYDELKNASKIIQAIKTQNLDSKVNLASSKPLNKIENSLYKYINPLTEIEFSFKTKILNEIDNYLRSKNPLVKQVTAAIAGSWQLISIINKQGQIVSDIRPLVRLSISVVVEKEGRMEMGSFSCGGRESYSKYLDIWQSIADRALNIALTNLEAIPAPAGEMPIVLGPGWPGILLHEAIGHGLEGDFNRKKTSAFSELLGKRVAAKGITIVDDGTIKGRRGSLNIDDEGNHTNKTVLIEDGILKAYMQDKINAKLMNVNVTGNGRREGFSSPPMPRMTNTYMLNGNYTNNEIISSVKKGIYATNFGGGQVDITSGKFVFSASEAFLIENGKITSPVKGATIIGDGPNILTKVSMVGNDMELDSGIGTCGKSGQSVPVGVGQPTLLIDSITVGGTKT